MASTLMAMPGWCRNLSYRAMPPNSFNQCLNVTLNTCRAILQSGGLKTVCPTEKRKWYRENDPWVKMPPDGRPVNQIFVLALPANNSTDTLVGSFRVPTGWYCNIPYVVNFYTDPGSAFVQGSGNLTWRYRIDKHYPRNYGAITTYLGSLTQPSPVRNGQIRARSGNIVYLYVNHASASSLSGGNIIMAAQGWE